MIVERDFCHAKFTGAGDEESETPIRGWRRSILRNLHTLAHSSSRDTVPNVWEFLHLKLQHNSFFRSHDDDDEISQDVFEWEAKWFHTQCVGDTVRRESAMDRSSVESERKGSNDHNEDRSSSDAIILRSSLSPEMCFSPWLCMHTMHHLFFTIKFISKIQLFFLQDRDQRKFTPSSDHRVWVSLHKVMVAIVEWKEWMQMMVTWRIVVMEIRMSHTRWTWGCMKS